MSNLRHAQCLLPRNATPLELRLSALAARLDTLPLTFTQLHDIEQCPVPFLPWLAWSERVEYWSPNWSASRKRQTITESAAANACKGTATGLHYALSQILPDGHTLQAWHELTPPGAPHTFVVGVLPPDRVLSIAELSDIQRGTESAKSARDSFAIRARVHSRTTTHSGGIGFAAERLTLTSQP